MFSLIIKYHDNILTLHPKANEKDSISIITSLIEKLIQVDSPQNKMNDDLLNFSKINDWSMHFDNANKSISSPTNRPSLILKQSLDDNILSILRNSESWTRDTLDNIRKLDEQSNKIDSIMHPDSIAERIDNLYRNITLSSPLVEAVDIDDSTLLNNVNSGSNKQHDPHTYSNALPDNNALLDRHESLALQAIEILSRDSDLQVKKTSLIGHPELH